MRKVPIDQFFISYGVQDRRDDEFVSAIFLPDLPSASQFHAFKISKRFDQDISAVLLAMRLSLRGDVVRDVRIAYGGMAATPARAFASEDFILGKRLDELAEMDFSDVVGQDFTPLCDMRASASYRLRVAGNLLQKAFIEQAEKTPLYLAGAR